MRGARQNIGDRQVRTLQTARAKSSVAIKNRQVQLVGVYGLIIDNTKIFSVTIILFLVDTGHIRNAIKWARKPMAAILPKKGAATCKMSTTLSEGCASSHTPAPG